MKWLIAAVALFASGAGVASEPSPPLPSGQYTFEHRFAEHPSIRSIPLTATIEGFQLVLVNPRASDPFPEGVVAKGELMWHAVSGQWIIGHSAADKTAAEVGGCSDGPEVVDLVARIYWTC